ncbi:MAG: 50S ribosomal protein L11 methyltransferase [Bacteroidia bacterium]|nr:50S ribosomal protein L11 methyltransferase [Bacteroidia bacterium]NNJ54978.1 50S ribosomal protein L11 methyltransferase [Bacteroidia bacterium]
MSYKAVHIACNDNQSETISYLLQELGFEGSAYENGRLIAYCKPDNYQANEVSILLNKFGLVAEFIDDVEDRNWNTIWEENFKDSDIGDNIHVRAPFHPAKKVTHDIIILPKMAFGTGHHETTQLSALALEKLDCSKKTVLDMGCGSGLLAILASQKGAKQVIAIDYDIHSVENTKENVQLNGIKNVEIQQADNLTHLTHKFDIIVSNIVKNINLNLLPQFVERLSDSGTLILCGFLETDLDVLKQAASAHHLKLIDYNTDNNWLQTRFTFK